MALGSRQHPLKITLVLDTLTSHIDLDDLAAFRLVCKSWFLSSIEKWRANKTLVLKPGTSYPDELDIESLEFYKLSSFPYKKLVVDGENTSKKLQLTRSYTFWKSLLSTVTHLTLKDINKLFHIDTILYMILHLIPNVTDLVYELNYQRKMDYFPSPVWVDTKTLNPYKSQLKRFTLKMCDVNRNCPEPICTPWEFFSEHFSHLELHFFICCGGEGYYLKSVPMQMQNLTLLDPDMEYCPFMQI